jgi:ferritin-like protein
MPDSPEPMMQFFAYSHLPEKLQAVSKPFGELAATIVATLPRNPERTVALRKLMEAKDCAVRALIYKQEG